MTLELPRRGFLLGLASLIAAPAVVKASSLMPVKAFDPAYYRYLVDYDIGSDRMMLRMDKALFPLPTPRHVAKVLTEAEVKAQHPEMFERFKNVEVEEGTQKYMTLDCGFDYWTLRHTKT